MTFRGLYFATTNEQGSNFAQKNAGQQMILQQLAAFDTKVAFLLQIQKNVKKFQIFTKKRNFMLNLGTIF